jgi:16S rRNA (cytidine1402-2'-O)-methyltransferase
MLAEGIDVAVTTDAGTPCISDPGYGLVKACVERGIEVIPVPGCCASVSALSVSGFDTREFAFYGFLPREKKFLREKLDSIRRAGVPVFVLYESPHRVVDLVEQLADVWPECMLCVCSDLTKRYERMYRGSAPAVLAELSANPNVDKGEYCMAVDISMLPPAEEKPALTVTAELFLLSRILEGDDFDEAVDAAKEAGYPRNELYKAKLKVGELFEE